LLALEFPIQLDHSSYLGRPNRSTGLVSLLGQKPLQIIVALLGTLNPALR
jgi:hypothetical protein